MTAMHTTNDVRPVQWGHLRETARLLRELRHDGVHVAARSVSRQVAGCDFGPGGDILVARRTGLRRWLLAIGDAMGSGQEAEDLAHAVRSALTHGVAHQQRPAEMLRDAESVVEREGGGRFVSLLLMELDAARRTIRMANAGHVEPLAVGRSGGVVALEGHAPALGIVPGYDYRDAGPLRLPPHVTLLAVTDGVTEAHREGGAPFGRDGAAAALTAARGSGPRGVVRRVLDDVHAHADGAMHDTATVVALKFD